MPDERVEKLDELHGADEDPYENRSKAILRLCEIGLDWRAAWGEFDGDPADGRELLEDQQRRINELESEVEQLREERREATRVANHVVEQDRGLLERVRVAISGEDPYPEITALEREDVDAEQPELVDAEPVDRE